MNCLSTCSYHKNRICIFWDTHTKLLKFAYIHMKSTHTYLWNTTKMLSLSTHLFVCLCIYVYVHAYLCWPGFWINTSPVPAEMHERLMFSVSQNEKFLFKWPFIHSIKLDVFASGLLHYSNNFRERLNRWYMVYKLIHSMKKTEVI